MKRQKAVQYQLYYFVCVNVGDFLSDSSAWFL